MAARVGTLSDGVHLNRVGLGLRKQIGHQRHMHTRLLDAAVAITEGADLTGTLRQVSRLDARILERLEEAIDETSEEQRTAIANYILSVSIGMQLD